MRVERRAELDAGELAGVLEARHAFVAEQPAVIDPDGRHVFDLAEGPVHHYRRTVELAEVGAGRIQVHQTVELTLAVPHWSFLFAWPARRQLAHIGPTHLPFWAPPQRLSARAATVLGLLCTASLVVGFLATLMTQTATFAVDEFGASNTAQGVALAATRGAALLTLPVVALADRRGRRRVVVTAMWIGPVIAATGAVAPNLVVLTVSQTLTRAVALALGITLSIMIAEELPARTRAYGVSLVSMAGALGVGLCLLALPLADTGERGWRVIYLLALLALPAAADLARRLPESIRFGPTHTEASFAGHGRRLWLLAASGLLVALFGAPASQFMNEFLRDDVGFTGGRIALFTIATNTPGALGIVIGGRLADVRGRRPVAAVALVGGTLATVAMFASQGWTLWAWSVTGAVVGAAAVPSMGVYGPELFPTSLRGRINGIITVVSLVGSVIGLVAVGALADRFDAFGPAFAVLAVGPLALALLVLLAYPETAGRTLEELNPEDRPPPATTT